LLRIFFILLLLGIQTTLLQARRALTCYPPEEASKHLDQELCLSAHIYEIIELPDGSRFLDICSPGTPDSACNFMLLSLAEDRNEVGQLEAFRDRDVHVRGIVRQIKGRSGIFITHVRQFYGGPPKFKANSKLLHGFNADANRPPLQDPNLRPHGGRSVYQNRKDQETSR